MSLFLWARGVGLVLVTRAAACVVVGVVVVVVGRVGVAPGDRGGRRPDGVAVSPEFGKGTCVVKRR